MDTFLLQNPISMLLFGGWRQGRLRLRITNYRIRRPLLAGSTACSELCRSLFLAKKAFPRSPALPPAAPTIAKIHPTSMPNLFQICENVFLGRFGSQVAPRTAPGRSGSLDLLVLFPPFDQTCRSKGRFWEPLEIEKGSKIAL